MTMHVRDGGTWKEVTDPQVRDGGTWKPVQAGYVRDGGTWKQFYTRSTGGGGGSSETGTVTISPSPTEGYILSTAKPYTAKYNATSATASCTGLTGTLTYAWTRVSGASSAGAFSVSGSATATATFSATIPLGYYTETWRCTVTGPNGTGYADVVVNLNHEADLGGNQ